MHLLLESQQFFFFIFGNGRRRDACFATHNLRHVFARHKRILATRLRNLQSGLARDLNRLLGQIRFVHVAIGKFHGALHGVVAKNHVVLVLDSSDLGLEHKNS